MRQGVERLATALGPLAIASLYRSEAVSPIIQPEFLNTVVTGTTSLEPEAVLAIAKQIEWAGGRRPAERWAPRLLDVDLLLFGRQTRDRPELSLPHPRLRERRFVLAPLAEIAADWPVPPDGRTVAQLLAGLGPAGPVERIDWSPP